MAWAKIRSSTLLLPMNRSGRSAPARRPRRLKRKKRTSSSADCWSSCLTSQSLGASESNMAWEAARQAAIGVGLVESEYFPVLTLSALGGYQSEAFPAPKDVA